MKKEKYFGELDETILTNLIARGKVIDKTITPTDYFGGRKPEDPETVLDRMELSRMMRDERAQWFLRTNPDGTDLSELNK